LLHDATLLVNGEDHFGARGNLALRVLASVMDHRFEQSQAGQTSFSFAYAASDGTKFALIVRCLDLALGGAGVDRDGLARRSTQNQLQCLVDGVNVSSKISLGDQTVSTH
jgi:hypothetical protein